MLCPSHGFDLDLRTLQYPLLQAHPLPRLLGYIATLENAESGPEVVWFDGPPDLHNILRIQRNPVRDAPHKAVTRHPRFGRVGVLRRADHEEGIGDEEQVFPMEYK